MRSRPTSRTRRVAAGGSRDLGQSRAAPAPWYEARVVTGGIASDAAEESDSTVWAGEVSLGKAAFAVADLRIAGCGSAVGL